MKPGSSWKEYKYQPTGKLLLSIEDLYVVHPIRRNFTDNNSGKIKDKLNDFIIALIICSQAEISHTKLIFGLTTRAGGYFTGSLTRITLFIVFMIHNRDRQPD